MTAMLPPTTSLHAHNAASSANISHLLWPAAATLVLHGAVLALLLVNWSPSETLVLNEKVLKTQLVTISKAPEPEPVLLPPPEPVAEVAPPTPAPLPEPIAEPPPEPVKPQIDHAAIARQRAKEAEQLKQAQAEEDRRLAEQQRQEQARQEQQERELAALNAARAAEQAEAHRQQALADQRKAEAASLSQYQPISKKPPAYPKRALDQRKEGDCTVEYTVSAQGKVQDPMVVDGGCDDPVFARPALSSAKSFRYKPRMVDGVAVAVPGVRNTFRFRLEQ